MPTKRTKPPMLPIYAYFDKGQIPVISCVYKATQPLPTRYQNFENLIHTLQIYIDNCLTPVWGVTARLEVNTQVRKGTWGFIFVDNADIANALGYHELTRDGFPQSQTFMETTKKYGEEPSVTASHEIAEMLLDPAIQMGALGPNNVWYAYEIADPVEAHSFLLNNIPMSDFVYPSWFEGFRRPYSTQFDYMRKCTRPFQILRGGYMPVFRNGRWTEIFGNKQDKKRFAKDAHFRLGLRKGSVKSDFQSSTKR